MVIKKRVRSEEQLEWVQALLERHEGPLLRYAERITTDPERARDVVQDTFLRLCEQPRAKVEGHEAQWLFRVCRNRALDVRRKEGRMHTDDGQALATKTSNSPQPVAVAEGKEVTSQLMGLVGRLPENQREVVLLKFQNGYSYKQIAEITTHSVSNVGYLLHTALKTLRTKMQTQPGLA